MSGLKYYVIDTETTGLSAGYHEMTEISVIRATDKSQLTKMIKCDYPERASLDALRITNKKMEDLSIGELKESVVEKIDNFLNEDLTSPAHRCIIGHNVSFDRKFIHALYSKVNKQFPAHLWLDTMAMTKSFAKTAGIIKPKVNLQASCDLVGIKKIAIAHTSKHDARNTFLLWKDLIDNKKVDYLPLIKNVPQAAPIKDDDLIDLNDLND